MNENPGITSKSLKAKASIGTVDEEAVAVCSRISMLQ